MSQDDANANDELVKQTYNRSKEIRDQIAALAGRDLHLFSISLVVLLVVSSGILVVAYPTLIATPHALRSDTQLLPRLLLALILLIMVFNIYMIWQKKELGATRRKLIEELIFNERTEALSLIDPTTQLYNRRAMELMLGHEVARATRCDSPLSLMVLNIADFENIGRRLGTDETDYWLYEAAQLVKNTLRSSDMVFRYKQNKFLVAMPDTSKEQVQCVIDRLNAELTRYNAEVDCKAELDISYGVGQYASGFRITDALMDAERKVFVRRVQVS